MTKSAKRKPSICRIPFRRCRIFWRQPFLTIHKVMLEFADPDERSAKTAADKINTSLRADAIYINGEALRVVIEPTGAQNPIEGVVRQNRTSPSV